MAALFVAAMREWKRSHEGARPAIGSLQQRIDRVMDVTIQREQERLENRLLILATVGSSAPFIGLFGTVWGIMTAFQAIAASESTNLAVVAPGHRRSAVRDGSGSSGRHSCGYRIQQILFRCRQGGGAYGRLC
jgi:hypothetical protein